METVGDIDELLQRFRLASRELFNHYFRIGNPYKRGSGAWIPEERFREVECLLFQKLVVEPANLPTIEYGDLHEGILVTPRYSGVMSVLLNREVDSGYWDYPLTEITEDAQVFFLSFFDWDQLDFRDNRFVRVQIGQWPAHPEAVGKHGLIDAHYARFVKSASASGTGATGKV